MYDYRFELLTLICVLALGGLWWYAIWRINRLQARVDPTPAQAARDYLAAPAPANPNACTPADRARQVLRRLIWPLLFVGGLASYKFQLKGLVWYLTLGLSGDELAAQRAALYGKFVDPVYFYSKASISIGLFTLVNALGWGSLLVVPVLVDWATGYYKQERADFPETRGFKGTFLLKLTDWQRILVFILVWALELFIADGCVRAGFSTP